MRGCINSRSTLKRRCLCIPSVLLFTALLAAISPEISAGNAGTADRAVTEYEVKAVYIYYFAKFVDWPQIAFATKSTPITIGILGDDEFATLLENIVKGKTIQEHPIEVRLLKSHVDPQNCHMIFIGSSEERRFRQIAESLRDRPVLTITETEDSSQAKGIMNLLLEGGKVQFEVNITDAEKARLKISSKLLRLARATVGGYSRKGE